MRSSGACLEAWHGATHQRQIILKPSWPFPDTTRQNKSTRSVKRRVPRSLLATIYTICVCSWKGYCAEVRLMLHTAGGRYLNRIITWSARAAKSVQDIAGDFVDFKRLVPAGARGFDLTSRCRRIWPLSALQCQNSSCKTLNQLISERGNYV